MNNAQPTLLALGDANLYSILFDKINTQFSTSQTYKNKPNQIQISNNLFKINTKYYDHSLVYDLVGLSELKSKLESIKTQDSFCLEGVFILLSNNQDLELLNLDLLEQFMKLNEDCFSVLVLNEKHDIKTEDLKMFQNKFQDLIEIKINFSENAAKEAEAETEADSDDDESDFSDLDELINCLFVHNWSNMTLKAECKAKEPKREEIKANENEPSKSSASNDAIIDENKYDEDSEFNFENLIMNLSEIKTKANGMSFEERKKYAESVVMNFWRSIGGDEKEIAGLDASDDDLE